MNSQQKLAALDGVASVDANPVTGTLLLHHHTNQQTIAEFAHGQGLFEIATAVDAVAPESETVSKRAYGSLRAFDQYVRGLSGGGADLWGVVFLIMGALGVNELIKGNVAAPATSLLWYAIGALMLAQGKRAPS